MATARRGAALRAVGAATGVALAGSLAAVGMALLATLVVGAVGGSLALLARVGILLVATQVLGFGGVVAAYFRWRGLTLSYLGLRVPTRRDLAVIAAGVVAALALALVGAAVLSVLSVEGASNQAAEAGMDAPELFLLLIPAAFLVIGPFEELLFRGAVQGRLREALGPAPSILLASVLFASIHFLALSGPTLARIASIALLFVPSLVLGAAYEYTGNLVVAAAIHALYDAVIFGVLYLVVTA